MSERRKTGQTDFNGGPEPEWFTQYAGSQGKSHGHLVIQTRDGGYLQVGETGFVQQNNAVIFVVKTDSQGERLWSMEMGDAGHNLGNSCVEDEDGNYIMAGGLNRQSCLVKLDSGNGKILWTRIFSHRPEASIEGIDVDESGGFICVGYELGHGEHNFYTAGEGFLLKCDRAGEKVWQKDISGMVGQAYRVKTLHDGYMIQGVDCRDFLVLKTDFDGNTIWNKRYGTTGEEHNFGMDIGADGSIFLTGHTRIRENWDTYTVKTDRDGNELWSGIAGQPRGYDPNYIHDEAWGIVATPDGGCVVAAGEDIALTDDGGLMVAVDSSQFGFLKLAPL